MKSEFLGDMVTAGRAVWEHKLRSTVRSEEEPPLDTVWLTVPEAATFKDVHATGVDWRVWMSWATAFGCLANAKAEHEECHTDACQHVVAKFAELNFLYVARPCPGNHGEDWEWIGNQVRVMPNLRPAMWPADEGRGLFMRAALHEWTYLQGTYVPEWELSPATAEYHNGYGTRLESQLFRDQDVPTLLALSFLCTQLATFALPDGDQEMAARAILCIQAHVMADMATLEASKLNVRRRVQQIFPGMDVTIVPAPGDAALPESLTNLFGPESLN